MAGDESDQPTKRLAGAPRRGERRADSRPDSRSDSRQGGMRAAGIAASRIAAPIVARRGGGVLARLKAEWAAIVGSDLATLTWPESLGRDGALKLRVAPTHALELQHRSPLLAERINLFFGRQIVARLALVQAPLPLPAPNAKPRRPAPSGRDAGLDARLGARLDNVADAELRAALEGLGRLVLAEEPEKE